MNKRTLELASSKITCLLKETIFRGVVTLRKEVPFTTHFVGKFRELLCISILGVVFKRKNSRGFFEQFWQIIIHEKSGCIFWQRGFVWKTFCIFPIFYLSEFGGTLKCVFRQYSEFFSLSEFSLEIGSKVVFFLHLWLCTQTKIYLESYTTLLGSLVRHVDVGSGLNITCAVVNYPLKLEYIIFYHNNKVGIVIINTKAILSKKTNIKISIVQTKNKLMWVQIFSKSTEKEEDRTECKL